MSDLKNSQSVLKLNGLYVDSFEYNRMTYQCYGIDPDISFKKEIIHLEKSEYKVSLLLKISSENEFELSIKMSGIFEISDDIEFKDSLLKNNAVAIIFPYIRSQLTLLTAQPNMQPIVLPPININNLLQNEKNE